MISILIASLALAKIEGDPHLTAQAPIVVPGGAGHFDFMNVDAKNRMVFACHPEKSTFTVVNLETGAVKEVDATTAVNGIDADSKGKRVFAAGPGKTLVEFDMTNWSKVASLPLDGPGDSVVFDSKNNVVYVDNDDGTKLWVVDPTTMKIVSTIEIKEAPEVMVLDTKRKRLFQNIKTTNTLQVIDTENRKVVGEYTLGELTSPHGLAMDKKAGKLFAVGKNGKLVILEADSGKILSTLDVTKSSDQIAYDKDLKRLYIPGSGTMNVVQIKDDGAEIIGSIPVPSGCHSVTVDSTSHDVWVAYADKKDSYVMKFAVTK